MEQSTFFVKKVVYLRTFTPALKTISICIDFIQTFIYITFSYSSAVWAQLRHKHCRKERFWKRVFTGVHNDSRIPPGAVAAFRDFGAAI